MAPRKASKVVVCLLLTSRERVLLILVCQRLTLRDLLIDEWFSWSVGLWSPCFVLGGLALSFGESAPPTAPDRPESRGLSHTAKALRHAAAPAPAATSTGAMLNVASGSSNDAGRSINVSVGPVIEGNTEEAPPNRAFRR